LTNTIIDGSGSSNPNVYFGSATSVFYGGSNLVQSLYDTGATVTGPAPMTNTPNLAPLGNYGGPTMTMPPLPGSPAIGAGSVAANTFATDQRGYPRTQNGRLDLGAVQAQIAQAGNSPWLQAPAWSATGGGTFQFGFTNAAHLDFTALTSTNLALPLTNWSILGNASEISPGQYQFTDASATNAPQRFYRVVSP
jgi:hypothetical protein